MGNFIAISQDIIDQKITELEKLENLKGIKRFSTRNIRKKLQIELQALEEGQRQDVLTPSITGTSTMSQYIDKNNYATYTSQIQNINKMYNNETDYGGDFLRALLDTRVSFIAGAGMSILSTRNDRIGNKIIEWINSFLNYNKYFGSRFIEDVLISELEGKCLLINIPNNKDSNIRIRSYTYYKTSYWIEMEEKDNQKIKSITYKPNDMEEIDLSKPDESVFIKIGGTPDRVNYTVPRIANVLTDIENISRIKYDLRKNNHLFGRVTPYFQTIDNKEAQSLLNKIRSLAWRIGRAFAGTATFSLVEPSGNASNALTMEITQGMKIISLNTGIPLMLLAYPELLSNRATSQDMLETINSSTIKERTKWEEGITELIQKAMRMAFERGWCPYNDPNSFVVKIDLTSFANLKQIIEIWTPLMMDNIISMDTLRSLLPGIDPEKEKRLIEAQKEENMERFQDNIKNNIKKDMEKNEEDEEKEEVEEIE